MTRISLFLCALLFATALPVSAQETAPADVASMLSTLESIKNKHTEAEKADKAHVLQDIEAAAANNAAAIAFYEEAIRATQFEGVNREATQFRDWKKKEGDRLKGREIQNAARLHLTYLAITLQHAAGAKVKDLIPALMAYAQQIDSDPDSVALQDDLMKRGLAESLFVRWYEIGGWISSLDKWEMSPGNTEGIYQKAILPELRAEKNPLLLQYWDDKLQREGDRASHAQLKFDSDKFSQVRKPDLLWNRAQDMLLLGQRSDAINAMFALIKANPNHPNEGNWISSLEQILRNGPASAAPVTSGSG